MSHRRGRLRRAAPGALLLVLPLAAFTTTSSARGEPAEIVKFAAAPAECPSSDFINGRFFELVGSDAPSRGSATVEVLAIEQNRYDFVVEIETAQGRGVRRFTAKTCELGAETAALIVALSLFPERAEALERTARASAAPDAPATAAPPAAASDEKPLSSNPPAAPAHPAPIPPAPPPSRHPKQRPTVLVSANGGFDATSMPRPALGLGIGLGLRPNRGLVFEVTAAAFAAQTVTQNAARSADFTAQSASAYACYPLEHGRLIASPCAGVAGVRIQGEGRGAQRNYERVGYAAGPALGAALRVRIAPPLGARIYAESFIPFVRPRFLLERAEVHESPFIGFSAFAGPELSF